GVRHACTGPPRPPGRGTWPADRSVRRAVAGCTLSLVQAAPGPAAAAVSRALHARATGRRVRSSPRLRPGRCAPSRAHSGVGPGARRPARTASRAARAATDQWPLRPTRHGLRPSLRFHARRDPAMSSIDPDLVRLLKRLKLGLLLPTLPERLTLARAQQLDYVAFLTLLLADE